MEAMAHGLAIVATRHAGIPEAVVDRRTGYLVAEEDTDAMSRCIVELAQDSDKRREFGYAGWLRARDHFLWELEKRRLRGLLELE